ncbi:bifunctional diaminohydroxyphosphoribosylaminopyrimidine deaminase/5-amino-6-(5-phosphoribosylamino)uracil reductase RibD [Enterococcus sp. DIV0876]|uniref:bifunctional diaminohydroxyphosphoribosylaminopyrimidine deaminase/5-amino-6-(5-phosphoribosylamino)uracil reductase RibD n=1 Tax=Enterococcus sp. DIV0876 TaxID=2774633 RepID=UPI003D2FB9AA
MHNEYMRLAIAEAKKGRHHTFTNPLVGAVIVKDQRIIAKGAHLVYGQQHAERNAIAQCHSSEDLFNSTLYVTLEPCNHQGKQPPCTQLIIDSGIKKVVIGQLDPNPIVAGQGKRYLEEQGIEVMVGVEESAVRHLNAHYNFYHQHQLPYVALKQAITLDGRIAVDHQIRSTITGSAVWQKVHQERGDYQGILVGSQTVLTDDPTLLTTTKSPFPPIRMVVDRRGRVLSQTQLALFSDALAPVWIFTEQVSDRERPPHVTVITMDNLTIPNLLKEIATRQVQSIYVEGGAAIHDAFLASGLWQESITYLAPKFLGGNSLASFASPRTPINMQQLDHVTMEAVGADICIRGRRREACSQD